MKEKEEEFIPLNWENNKSIIKVIGVGGGGGNAVSHMYRSGLSDVDFVVCNTDAQALDLSPVPDKLQLGNVLTRGRGAGCNPDIAKQAALESEDRIRALFEGATEMVFITAGMGGGTGTGAAPVIARIAKEMELLTVGVVTLPFRDEGKDFLKRALDGIQEMQQYADSMIIIDNEKLYRAFGDLPIFEAFQRTDDVLNNAVKGISEIITRPGFVNVDFADVKMVMTQSGMALMGTGSGFGENRALKAVESAFTSPLLNDADLTRARNVLINITSGKEKALSMAELSQIMGYIADYTGGVSNFKRGVICDPSIQDEIRVTVIATGFSIHSLPPIAVYGNDAAKEMEKEKKESVYLDGEPMRDQIPAFVPEQVMPLPEGGNDEFRITNKPSVLKFQPVAAHEQAAQRKKPVLILDADQNIAELEKIPAYKRQAAGLKMNGTADIAKPSPVKIEEKNGQQRLSTDNAYIHQTQD
ncbi:MAG: cell division protein FtsZ [Bacteroidales bacterium]|jgi:cell division protein FtsZ|nr:cell division protein FtsZ [Bacteroidales bacterium]NLH24045.1 cell division protein FtsZ [Bacteroidales bacterium]HPJ82270.1 cell division protein FtsZ [Bacteroidales bacterium]